MGAYAATKAAVVSLTRTLAAEGAEGGVNVNAIAPRIIDTPANRTSMPDADTSTWLKPREIARVVAFLTSEAGRIVNGSVLTLNRG
jgi:NAD(P)-dependent dehydrogenase (short-subunit alcohol dehydrogenase family)